MDRTLIASQEDFGQGQRQAEEQNGFFYFMLTLKIAALVALTYGLMVLMFFICDKIEHVEGDIASSYEAGGGIILALFLINVVFWAVLWVWGAKQREQLRTSVVERQLDIIRKEEEAEELREQEAQERAIQERRYRS